MKKNITVFCLLLIIIITSSVKILAIRNKEQTVDIYIYNINEDINDYMMDILVKGDSCANDFSNPLDQLIASYSEDGYIAGSRCNEDINIEKVKQEKNRHLFQFAGKIPKEIKIIIARNDESIITTKVIKIEAYNSKVYLNGNTFKISVQNVYFNIFAFLIFNFLIILILKLFLLILFRLNIFNQLKTVLPLNIIIVGFMSIILSYTNYLDGYPFAFKNLIFLQFVFFIIEMIFIFIKLKDLSKIKRIFYVALANILAFLTQTLLLIITVF